MKLTPEQKRGIEERFAVLQMHLEGQIDQISNIISTGEDDLAYVEKRRLGILHDIEACRDEVLVLVEMLECPPSAADVFAALDEAPVRVEDDEETS